MSPEALLPLNGPSSPMNRYRFSPIRVPEPPAIMSFSPEAAGVAELDWMSRRASVRAIADIEDVEALIPREDESVAVAHEGVVNTVVVRYRRAAGSGNGPRPRLREIKNHQRTVGRIFCGKRVELPADVRQCSRVQSRADDRLGPEHRCSWTRELVGIETIPWSALGCEGQP